MKNQFKKITIIGNGKVCLRLVLYLLSSGVSPDCITVIIRPDSSTNRKELEEFQITLHSHHETLSEADLVVLAVRPVDAPELLQQLQKVTFKDGAALLSLVSDLSIEKIFTALQWEQKKKALIARGTLNTNIDLGCGVIAITASNEVWPLLETLFANAGAVIRMTGQQLKKMVAGIGSMNALDLLFIFRLAVQHQKKTGATERKAVMYAYKKVLAYIQSITLNQATISTNSISYGTGNLIAKGATGKELNLAKNLVHQWILAKIQCYQVLGFSQVDAIKLAATTLKSAAQVLEAIQAESFEAIENRINTVLTKKGCTRDGFEELKATPDIQDMLKKLQTILLRIYDTSKKLLPKVTITA